MQRNQQDRLEHTDEPVSIGCSSTVRSFSAMLSLGCIAGAVLVVGILLLASLNMRIQNPSHILIGFMGGTSITVFLVSSVRLGFYPSNKGLLWIVVSGVGFGLFILCFSLPGVGGIFH
jgi:membrane-bound ClpP family serine protease